MAWNYSYNKKAERDHEKPYYQTVVDTLKSVKRPGFFTAGGVVSLPLPSLSIGGSILGLPLCEAQAKKLIEISSRAPFGRGEETIIDTSVRCTWQLNPSQFSINNPNWEKSLDALSSKLRAELGCSDRMNIAFELYKMLLYEPGGFFKKHRDTEKTNQMFGTLVIQLPSDYDGGQLTVFHRGKQTEYNFSGPEACYKFYYAAFYADCQHEIKPVTKGYRLCLIYNLLYRGVDVCPAPADNEKQVSAIVSAMTAWNEDAASDDSPEMMTYMLEHKYCEASLSFELLKNGDRAVAEVLIQAKVRGNFDLCIGNVHLTENWSAYHDDWDDDDYTPGELCDEELRLENVRSCDGEKMSRRIDISRDSFVPENFFDSIDPDEEEFEEATGNEGATLYKQYNWAALLLWPVKQRAAVIGLDNMIQIFEQDIKKGKNETRLVAAAKEIMAGLRDGFGASTYVRVLQSLLLLDNKELIVECLDTIVKNTSSYSNIVGSSSFCKAVSTIGNKYGWSLLMAPLKAMFEKCASDAVEVYCQFLLKTFSDQVEDEQKKLCKCLTAAYVNFLVSEPDATPVSQPSSSAYCYGRTKIVHRSKEYVCRVVKTLKSFACDDLLVSFVNTLRAKPVRYPILNTVGPAILDISRAAAIDGSLQELLSYCTSKLEKSIQKIPTPSSYARPVKFSCSCNDCVPLKQFLQHPDKEIQRFRMSEKRRYHLELQIRGLADVTHSTERIGSPHTLVVTKTQEAYERAVKKHEAKQTLLATLRSLQGRAEPPTKKQKTESYVSSVCSSSSSTGTTPVIDLTV